MVAGGQRRVLASGAVGELVVRFRKHVCTVDTGAPWGLLRASAVPRTSSAFWVGFAPVESDTRKFSCAWTMTAPAIDDALALPDLGVDPHPGRHNLDRRHGLSGAGGRALDAPRESRGRRGDLGGTGARFRAVGWVCFGVLLLTGTVNLWARGVRLEDFTSAAWRQSPLGSAVLWKLAVFSAVLLLSAVHDFHVGPAATAAIQLDPDGPGSERLRRQASWMGRVNAVLALLLVALAVVIVRGW